MTVKTVHHHTEIRTPDAEERTQTNKMAVDPWLIYIWLKQN